MIELLREQLAEAGEPLFAEALARRHLHENLVEPTLHDLEIRPVTDAEDSIVGATWIYWGDEVAARKMN